LEETYSLMRENAFLNPSSIHSAGKYAKRIMEKAKETIASSLNAKCHDIYFTSGASEANNMVLSSMEFGSIFTIKTEHDSIIYPALNHKAEFIENSDTGLLDLSNLEKKIKTSGSKSFLCSISYINNESGVIQNLAEIAKIVHEAGGLLHADCSQLIGKKKFDFAKEDIDIITFTGHKFHAGPGSGAAIFKSGLNIKPFILGGGQQNFKRAGTENIPAIFALSRAILQVNNSEYL
jgi:cysteine desulfurase